MTDLKDSACWRSSRDGIPTKPALWESLPEAQRKRSRPAAMDMGADFAAATRTAAPQAQIVHDKFHVSKLLNEAVDKVRKEEHRRLLAKGDESLKGTSSFGCRVPRSPGSEACALKSCVNVI